MMMKLLTTISNQLKHFWHVVSNVRPIFWITLYVAFVPLFALFYWWLPVSDFRLPDGADGSYGDWVYYSIVTLTTLGFGDFTPAKYPAQIITAVEVMCGLVTIGFFLNSVGSMKSEIDVESELEKQRHLHNLSETDKLVKNTPVFLHKLNKFLTYCYAVTTPLSKRATNHKFNENFEMDDLADMNKPSGLPDDLSGRSAIQSLMKYSANISLYLDSLQSRIDLSLWPQLLEDCFAFVANYQMLSDVDSMNKPNEELAAFIRTNASLARRMETLLTQISAQSSNQ